MASFKRGSGLMEQVPAREKLTCLPPTGFARSVVWKIMSNKLNVKEIRISRPVNTQQTFCV